MLLPSGETRNYISAQKERSRLRDRSPKVLTPSPRIPEPTIPPTPYVNQAAVEQHMRVQSPPVLPRNTATIAAPPQESPGTSVAQEPLITLATLQQTPPQAQEQTTKPHINKRNQKARMVKV